MLLKGILMKIYVGVCTFAYKYLRVFSTLEVQRTFYNIPKPVTVEKWKKEAPRDFIYNFKIFQGITHELNSPTWRRYTGKDKEELRGKVGSFKLNKKTMEYWDTMTKIAKTLNARVMVAQTPPKFNPTNLNIGNIRKTFEYLKNKFEEEKIKTLIGWEPRGEWLNKKEDTIIVIKDFDNVIHVVDLIHHEPLLHHEVYYFRLHGIPYLNYKYTYTLRDYGLIMGKIERLEDEGAKEVFVMFNNVNMVQNAKKFKDYLEGKGWKVY